MDASLPFEDPDGARRRLDGLAERGLGAAELGRLEEAARSSPDPDRSLEALAAWVEARCERGWAALPKQAAAPSLLATLSASSEPFGRAAAAEPLLISALAHPGVLERPSQNLESALVRRIGKLQAADLNGAQRLLRQARRRELARLAVRELEGRVDVIQSARELSLLAEAVCQAALAHGERELGEAYGPAAAARGGFCVLALGKLGGDELNFSSDIDLVFLYRGDGETGGGRLGRTSHRELYTRLAERFVRLVGETTAEGFCYRVDLNLRPEGRNGPLVNPLDAIRGYYETYGRSWERLALLRARPLAGDLALGRDLLVALVPFVYRRSTDFGMVDEMRELKRRVEVEAARRGEDLKLGPGGIREIELLAQTLALLHGGRRPALRQRGLLPLLDRLETEGILTSRDRDQLADAYRFLRRVEHRLQMLHDRQTQLLPATAEERRRLALRLGYRGGDPLAAFETELGRHRRVAREAFDELWRTREPGPAAGEQDADLLLALDGGAVEAERAAALGRLGFHGEAALGALHRLSRPQGPLGPGSASSQLLPRLLAELTRTTDPDRALIHFADWACSLKASRSYLRLLADDPASLRRLAGLLGGSALLSHELVRYPELVEQLLPTRPPEPEKSLERLSRELGERLAPAADEVEATLSAACRYRNEELLRVGLLDLANELGVEQVGEQLPHLARAVLGAILALSGHELADRHGQAGGDARLCVVALGSLGGRELSYGSDLDLLFLYSEAGESSGGRRGPIGNQEYFARLAQRLIALLSTPVREGLLYRTDSRLRPSGNQGTLVTSLDAFRSYHGQRSALWERQALLKAGFAAGDRELFDRARAEVIEPAVYRAGTDAAQTAQEMDRLRRRMETELAGEEAARYNPKIGRGGLVDIEFTVQYLQLVHGREVASVRGGGTLAALAALGAARLLPGRDAGLLREAAIFLRRLEGRLRIARDVRQTHLPERRADLETLARRLGFGTGLPGAASPADQLLAEYRRRTSQVREIYDRTVGEAARA